MPDQGVEAGVAYPADHTEGQSVHQVVELGAAGQDHWADLPDGFPHDGHQQRDDQERADRRRTVQCPPPNVGEENGTGPRKKVHSAVNPMASTPVSAKASTVTGSGWSSQTFTS